MDSNKGDADWVHLLLRGDKSSQGSVGQDDYVTEFAKNQMTSATLPILEFQFKNIDRLAEYLEDLHDWSCCKGLIITSPRVVEAISQAIELISPDRLEEFWWNYKSDLCFVLGERTASICDEKLKIIHNPDAPTSCDSRTLAKYIRDWLRDEHNTWPEESNRNCQVVLTYPKSSLADNTIEKELANVPNLELNSVVVYETLVTKDLKFIIIEKLKEMSIPTKSSNLVINMIFFSPSGLNGYMQIDQANLIKSIKELFPDRNDIEIKFSSIGKTTEAALKKHGLNVFCVSDKPKPASLVEAITKSSKYYDLKSMSIKHIL